MFDSTIAVLNRGFYDSAFVHAHLGALSEDLRPAAAAAGDPASERDVIRRLLARLPVSHLALMSLYEYSDLAYDLSGTRHIMLGMQLFEDDGRYFASMVLTGGPADRAGVRDGDEISAIDSLPPAQSPHLDWREDDVYLPDGRDPPAYGLRLLSSPSLELRVVRVPSETTTVRVTPAFYSALDATRASTRLIVRDGVRVGYIRWWYMHTYGIVSDFRGALTGPLASSDALVLDLRGRGGSDKAVEGILQLLVPTAEKRLPRPIVALIDRQTRSAKEELAYELRALGLGRLVGEPTAGAFIPAGFAELGHDAVLMYPIFQKRSNPYIGLIEGHPIQPDVAAPWIGPYSGGRDSIIQAGIAEAVRLVRAGGPLGR